MGGVFVVIAVLSVAVFRWRATNRLEARLAEIRAAGYPATSAELNQWYAYPDNDENAADVFALANDFHVSWSENRCRNLPVFGDIDLPKRAEPLSDEMANAITEYLADNSESLALLHEGAAMDHCRYPIDFTQDSFMPLNHWGGSRIAVALLQLEALLYIERADSRGVSGALATGFGVAASLENEPLIVSHLCRQACQSLTLTALERALNRIQLTDEHLRQLGQVLLDAEASEERSLLRALVGERCVMSDVIRYPKPGVFECTCGSRAPLARVYQIVGFAESEALLYIDLLTQYIQVMQLPPHQRHQAALALDHESADVSESRILLREAQPSLAKFFATHVKNLAELRTARVALAVERYRLHSGDLPGALDELVPEYLSAVPLDPFDGQGLRYRVLNPGYVVYSVDMDGQDNEGKDFTDVGISCLPGSYLPMPDIAALKDPSVRPACDIPFTVERQTK